MMMPLMMPHYAPAA